VIKQKTILEIKAWTMEIFHRVEHHMPVERRKVNEDPRAQRVNPFEFGIALSAQPAEDSADIRTLEEPIRLEIATIACEDISHADHADGLPSRAGIATRMMPWAK
jgi:hypothetical protein